MVDAVRDVVVGGFEGRVGVDPYRVGDGPVQPLQGRVEFFVGVVAHRDDQIPVAELVPEADRSGVASASGRGGGPWPRHAGWMRGPGWVPAEVAGMVLSWFQVAAASWDRAELAVQTNTIRGSLTAACPLPASPLRACSVKACPMRARPVRAAARTMGWSLRSWT